MAERTSDQKYELYQVIVMGAMNPAIHHPLWYREIGLLSESEAAKAQESDAFMCLRHVAQFKLEGIHVACDENRWWTSSNRVEDIPRLIELTTVVFQKLEHTPVSAYAYDFVFDRPTAHKEVGKALASQIVGDRLGVMEPEDRKAEVVFRCQTDPTHSRRLLVRQGDVASGFVIVGNHAEYKIGESSGFVDLRDKLLKHFEDELKVAREQTDRVVATINSWETNEEL